MMVKPIVLKNSKFIKGIYVKLTMEGKMVCHYCQPYIKKFFTYIPYFFGDYPDTVLWKHNYINSKKVFKKLYVNPAARISRDLLRNSGYQLVRDKDNADAIVVPYFSDSYYYSKSLERNMVVFSKTTRHTYIVEFQKYAKTELKDDIVDSLKESICNFLGQTPDELEFYYKGGLDTFTVYFIPPIDDYCDILGETYGNPYICTKKYVTDMAIPTTCLYEMNIETLEMASRMDTEFLEKFLIACPWKEYPFTLNVFLEAERNYEASSCTSKNAKMVLDYVDFNSEYNKPISSKDLEMIQSWIFHKIGIDNEKSAFVPFKSVSVLDSRYQKIIRMKYAVSRISIPEDKEISFTQLKERAKF